jgi:hypothetical protein
MIYINMLVLEFCLSHIEKCFKYSERFCKRHCKSLNLSGGRVRCSARQVGPTDMRLLVKTTNLMPNNNTGWRLKVWNSWLCISFHSVVNSPLLDLYITVGSSSKNRRLRLLKSAVLMKCFDEIKFWPWGSNASHQLTHSHTTPEHQG